jgi:spore coat polysaccharide biosynthesis protein SpsF (cytidylyltransferase family)
MKRIVLHTKAVMNITGKSERYSRELIKKMKEHYLKKSHQYVTIKECSQYLGLDVEEVEDVLF